ncbi:beta-galactosidase BglB [Paenibacillus sp. strain BS8-2]
MKTNLLDRVVIESHIQKIIQGMLQLKAGFKENTPVSIISMDKWDWSQGVGLFSLYLYYKETKDKGILEYLIHWFEQRMQEGLPAKNINTMCPMLTLSYLYEETGRDDFLQLCKEWLRFAMEDIPRTAEMGFAHATIDGPNETQLWDDTLYMTVLFVGRMGALLEEEMYYQESIRQFLVHLKYLTDTRTGLFFHGFTFDGNHHFADALWGRGNAWYTAGLVDYLEMITLPEGVAQFLITSLERQVIALEKLQAADGMWHTILDDPTSYVESSATSGFAYGILKAVRMGYLDKRYEEVGRKALNAVLSRIDQDGTVRDVSYGTRMGETLQYYKDIPVCPMPYGQSMALLMMVESLRHV